MLVSTPLSIWARSISLKGISRPALLSPQLSVLVQGESHVLELNWDGAKTVTLCAGLRDQLPALESLRADAFAPSESSPSLSSQGTFQVSGTSARLGFLLKTHPISDVSFVSHGVYSQNGLWSSCLKHEQHE